MRERGLEGTSVADVMGAAGMTHGGFYKHFDSKDALLAAALDAAFDDVLARFGDESERVGRAGRGGFAAFYLSDAHLRNAGIGCPLPAVAGEIGRSDVLKQALGRGVRRMIVALAADSGTDRAEAARRLATLVGGIMIARASDPDTASLVMDAIR